MGLKGGLRSVTTGSEAAPAPSFETTPPNKAVRSTEGGGRMATGSASGTAAVVGCGGDGQAMLRAGKGAGASAKDWEMGSNCEATSTVLVTAGLARPDGPGGARVMGETLRAAPPGAEVEPAAKAGRRSTAGCGGIGGGLAVTGDCGGGGRLPCCCGANGEGKAVALVEPVGDEPAACSHLATTSSSTSREKGLEM